MSWDLALQALESCRLIMGEKALSTLAFVRIQTHKWMQYVKTQLLPPMREFVRFFRRQPQGKESDTTGGLSASIPLPSTGEEAMHRLLACKGRDPYSILGKFAFTISF